MELSNKKTRTCHICQGFNFLGFNIKIRLCPHKKNSGIDNITKTNVGYHYDYNLTGIYIKPSEKSFNSIKLKIKEVFNRCRGKNAEQFIKTLNP